MEDDMSSDMKLAHYIEIGAIDIAGVTEDGELMFAINEKAKEVAPELWQSHVDYVDKTLIDMYEQGYIKVEYDENLEAEISISPEGIEIAKELGVLPIDFPETPED